VRARHITGDDALAIAADLARQKAIESPHIRVPQTVDGK
jgi:hypothetical protein